MRETCIIPLYGHNGFKGFDTVSVVKGAYLKLPRVVGAQGKHRDRLVNAADDTFFARKNLHHDAGMAIVFKEHFPRPYKIFVGIPAGFYFFDRQFKYMRRKPFTSDPFHA
jgi:hypothetical protein